MTEPDRQIGFDQLGIANVLRTYTLRVPPHQRDFSWTDREVKALFRDISKAITAGDPEYFLGSIRFYAATCGRSEMDARRNQRATGEDGRVRSTGLAAFRFLKPSPKLET